MNFSMISKSLLIALPMLALGACSSVSETDTESGSTQTTTAAEVQKPIDDTVQTNAIEAIELTAEEKLIEQYTAAILDTTINFEFDKSLIMPKYALILDAHAKFLIDNGTTSITVEGHADEKGTPEYNIALGERRALSVSTYLENMGVSTTQITVVSYGEEKPSALGHNEAAWADNRRAELVY